MSERDTETETDAETETESDISESIRDETEHSDDGQTATVADVEALRGDVVAFAEDVEDRIIERDALENDLKSYVRQRQRRGHARGWGPYLVLLYGTVMTLGAFFLLSGWWAILAMIIVWLSTLGLYTLMAFVGFFVSMLRAPGKMLDRIQNFRS
jgi:hypothetical protein